MELLTQNDVLAVHTQSYAQDEQYLIDKKTHQDELRRQDKQLRRITKHKKKLLEKFEHSTHTSEGEMRVLANALGYSDRGVIRKEKRCDAIEIPRQIREWVHFMFPGFINVELHENNVMNILENCGGSVMKVSKQVGYYSGNHSQLQFSTQFDAAIQMLERTCDFDSYVLAQDLRRFKVISEQNYALIKQYRIENYTRIEEVSILEKERRRVRDELIDSYLQANMNEEDFFFCCDGGIHFSDGSVKPSKFRVSTNMFTFIGVDEGSVETFLVRNDTFTRMLPYESRKRLTKAFLSMKLIANQQRKLMKQDRRAGMSQQQQSSFGGSELIAQPGETLLKSIEVRTIDEIRVVCDVIVTRFWVEFPGSLAVAEDEDIEYESLNEMESFQTIKFLINKKHLDSVRLQRERGMTSEWIKQENPFEIDFEYSLLSSIFIEKYYQKEYEQLDPKSSLIYDKFKEQRCGYRQLEIQQ